VPPVPGASFPPLPNMRGDEGGIGNPGGAFRRFEIIPPAGD